jgi:hypothetical protein
MTFSCVGVCIGYAVWNNSNPKNDEAMNIIFNDPRYDAKAFNDFFTWEFMGAFGEDPTEPPADKDTDWNGIRYSLNIAGTRIRKKNEFSWFRKNTTALPFGVQEFQTFAYGHLESDSTYNIDDANVVDAFSYAYYKTPKMYIDGTYLRDTSDIVDYPPLFPFVFNAVDQDENTKKLTNYTYLQHVNVSPSIWYTKDLFKPDLITIYHVDNRALIYDKNNTIKHDYLIDVTSLMDCPLAFTLGFQWRTWDLLLQGVDGGLDDGFTVNFTSVDGTLLTLNKVWDTNNRLLHLSLNQWINKGRKYKIYLSWTHTV